MKSIIMIIMFVMISSVFAQDITFTRKDIIDMSVEATVNSACAENILSCLKISKATCETDVKKLLMNDCASKVPETVSNMEKVPEYAGQLAGCTVKALLTKHNSSMVKNINSAACQSLR